MERNTAEKYEIELGMRDTTTEESADLIKERSEAVEQINALQEREIQLNKLLKIDA